MNTNTVDALKKLYKTMVGTDWPYGPNPTDAEVISKLADDLAEASNDSGEQNNNSGEQNNGSGEQTNEPGTP